MYPILIRLADRGLLDHLGEHRPPLYRLTVPGLELAAASASASSSAVDGRPQAHGFRLRPEGA